MQSLVTVLAIGLLLILMTTPQSTLASSGHSESSTTLPNDHADEVEGAIFATPETMVVVTLWFDFVKGIELGISRPDMIERSRPLAKALILWPESLPRYENLRVEREDQVVRIFAENLLHAFNNSSKPAEARFVVAAYLATALREAHAALLQQRYHSPRPLPPLERTAVARKLALALGATCEFALTTE